MSPVDIGLFCIGLLLLLLALRLPIGVALGLAAFTGIWWLRGQGAAFSLMGATTYQFVAH